jgi:hypothetical protein
MPKKTQATTAQDAFDGLMLVEELSAAETVTVLPDLQGYGQPNVWGLTAYVSMCERTGSAGVVYLFNIPAVLESNGSVYLLTRETYAGPAGIEAQFDTGSGAYVCTARLSRPPTHIGDCRFRLDQRDLGTFELVAAPTPTNYSFPVRLGQGSHRFVIEALNVPFWFHSLAVHNVPENAPA